jgi:hypothetical protein
MLGYDMQTSTVKQRVMAGLFEQCNVYFGCTKNNKFLFLFTIYHSVTRLRHCATSRKDAVCIPNRVVGNFH